MNERLQKTNNLMSEWDIKKEEKATEVAEMTLSSSLAREQVRGHLTFHR